MVSVFTLQSALKIRVAALASNLERTLSWHACVYYARLQPVCLCVRFFHRWGRSTHLATRWLFARSSFPVKHTRTPSNRNNARLANAPQQRSWGDVRFAHRWQRVAQLDADARRNGFEIAMHELDKRRVVAILDRRSQIAGGNVCVRRGREEADG